MKTHKSIYISRQADEGFLCYHARHLAGFGFTKGIFRPEKGSAVRIRSCMGTQAVPATPNTLFASTGYSGQSRSSGNGFATAKRLTSHCGANKFQTPKMMHKTNGIRVTAARGRPVTNAAVMRSLKAAREEYLAQAALYLAPPRAVMPIVISAAASDTGTRPQHTQIQRQNRRTS